MNKDELIEKSLRLLVSVIGVFIICIVLLIFKLNVNAESPSVYLPYAVNEGSYAIDSSTADYLIDFIKNRYPDESFSNYYIIFHGAENFWYDYSANIPCETYFIYFIDYDTLETSWTPLNSTFENFLLFDSDYHMTFNFNKSVRFTYQSISLQGDGVNSDIGGSGTRQIFGSDQVISVQNSVFNFDYQSYYPVYVSTSFKTLHVGDGSGTILTNSISYTPDVFESGHAQEPSFDSDTIIDSSLHPNIKPTFPTFNTYNITNYSTPSIDTSTVETLLESLIDVVVYNATYVVTNIVGAIQNLWNNLGNFLEYIGDLLSYLFNRVINTIKQTADTLYQNFKELFEPVLNSFANLINIFNTLYILGLKDGVFDIPTLFGALFVPNQSDLALLVDTFVEFDYLQTASVSIKSLINGVFDVLNDDAVYSIHIQGFSFHGVSVPEQEISFDWYLPYKATGDIFISAFLIVGYLYWLWTRLSGIFHGVAPDSVGTSKITSEVH